MIITNLLTNMMIVGLSGSIPTNTPAYQQCALQVMIAEAQGAAQKWNLETALISSNKVTYFEVTPYPRGFSHNGPRK
jgi:hypothetical protein